MFSEEEIKAGYEVAFNPTEEQVRRFASLTDERGHLHGTVVRKVLHTPYWYVRLEHGETTVARSSISILSESAQNWP